MDNTNDYVPLIVNIIGTVIVAGVAIYSIRKTAEESRVSNVHNEMVQNLILNLGFIYEILELLIDISNRVTYELYRDGKNTETAYKRYWAKIDDIGNRSKELLCSRILLFPELINTKMGDIFKVISEAMNNVNNIKMKNDSYPETDGYHIKKLKEHVEQLIPMYQDLLNLCRGYSGTDSLNQITASDMFE
ncbi:MAG: hypothetical protein ABIH39_04155, partial [Candidatus Margulisiibacteriota bacterium]